MLDSKVFVQMQKDLKALGLDSGIRPVSNFHTKVEVAVSLETLQALIAQAARLNALREFMQWRYELACRQRNQDKQRSHAGTLFFIDTGKQAFARAEEFAQYEERLRQEYRDRGIAQLDTGKLRDES